ncbi:fimbrial protein [Variovorax sp. V512]|uniref:fimbrial protein n=2 Tax=Comamonadaceae TaxID=80864 RepID=UPI0034E85592
MNCKGWLSRSGSRIMRAALVCLVMCLLGVPSMTLAQTKCAPMANQILAVPATIAVPRDLPVGGILMDWRGLSSATTSMYECTGNAVFGAAIRVAGLSKSGIQTSYSGAAVSVFETNVPGVGVAFAIGLSVQGLACMSGVLDPGGLPSAGVAGTVQSAPEYGVWFQCGLASSTKTTLGIGLRMQYVKTGPISGGTVTPSASMLESRYSINGVLSKGAWGVTVGPTVIQGPPTCTVQDVAVALGSHKSSAFSRIGATGPAKAFAITVTCPSGMLVTVGGISRPLNIGYQFAAPAGVLVPSNGVIALSPGATASGIGVQLKDAASAVLQFGKNYPLTGYNVTSGSTHSVKLQAAYYQTGAVVGPGTANAVMTFTLNYQ